MVRIASVDRGAGGTRLYRTGAAATQAVLTHGGMGYARDFHVERLLREAMIPRLAPVSAQLVLCYIAEKVLGLPRSY